MRIAAAIKQAGSVRKLAEALGVSTQAVYKMRKQAEKPLAKQHAEAVRKVMRGGKS